MMESYPLDVHSLTLNEAKKVIEKEILRCYEQGKALLYVNHGFNKGNKIKTWCLNEGSKINHVIKVSTGDNEGISVFYIEQNIKIY